ncbi:MAG: sugar ABC transporter substrate-binding protein [Burkholderiaceae bacterium]|nr:sugar ABC transporter substrate-binding protein [Burkholderiaceae bacterium]
MHQASAQTKSKYDALYSQVSKLQGQDALKFFQSLPAKGVQGSEVIEFFIDLPVSSANTQIAKIFKDEGFAFYLQKYPRGAAYQNFQWKPGMGTQISGPFSKQSLKLPFTDYVPLKEGPVGDPSKKYRIGVTFHGFSHPWLLNWADAARWEAERHPNVDVRVLDAEFDNAKMAQHFDTFIAEKVDGILVWPMVEAPTGPPAKRAQAAGIPVVSVDRLTGDEKVNSRITGNFPANGAQAGMYLVHRLSQEGNLSAKMVMLRKPLGSTADSVRTGHFLKVLSYFPGIQVLRSYHDTDSREEAFSNAQAALQAFSDVDVFFGTGDHEALAALEATKQAKRLESRAGKKKIVFLSIDDSKEALTAVKNGEFGVNTPYTPLISDIGMRVLLNIVTKSGKMPHDVITPNIPMITQNGETIFGLKTQTPDEWYPYTFGPPMKK